MSITINGATNTLTAASGLTIAGNTAVTGALSTTSTASLAALKVFTASVQSTGLGGASPIIQVSNTGGSTSTISNRGYGIWAGLALGRSGSSVLDTLSATADTNALGYITFDGVNSSNHPTSAGYIVGTQSGAAGATYLGGTIDTYVGTNAAAATKITSISSTGLAVTGTLSATGVTDASRFKPTGAPSASEAGLSLYSSGFWLNTPSGTIGYLGVNGSGVAAVSSTGLAVTGTLSASGITSVTDTTDATSTTAASLKTAGGLGVAKKTYCGDNIVMASGKGIDFSATSDGSGTTTSEVLSDYEEGTWTPTYVATGTNFTSVTYAAVTSGKYTKVGRKVTISGVLRTDAITVGAGAGSVVIGGLPFAVASGNGNYAAMSIANVGLFGGDVPVNARAAGDGGTTIELFYRTTANGADINLAVSDMATGATANSLTFGGTYFTS